MTNLVNEDGQISGMAGVLSGPDAGNIHAFLATPRNERLALSIADVAPTQVAALASLFKNYLR
jgi:hypothetical protein